MAFIAIALILVLITLVLTFLQYYFNYWERLRVPHERPKLIVGSLAGVGHTVHFKDVLKRNYQRFKGTDAPFVGLFFFFEKVALILDLDLVKQILIKDFSKFQNRGVFNNARDDPISAHLFSLDGMQWKSMRTKLTPVFTSGKMRYMFPTMVEVSKHLPTACSNLAEQNKLHPGVIELKDVSARFTTDVIGSCAYGVDCNSLHDPNAEFRLMGRSINEKQRHSQTVTAFMSTNSELARRLRMKFFTDEVNNFFMDVVRRTVEYRIKNKVKRNDFMDILIDLKAKNEELARAGGGIDLSNGLTVEQMAAQAFVFFVAGFDTSSTTMAMCLYELALHPEIQERLRIEIVEMLAKYDGELSYEGLKEVPYLEQVISETLRKYPVLPFLRRKCIQDFPVPNTNYIIESGTTIVVPVDSLHYDPEIYPEPEKFDPERFTPEAMKERHPCAHLPFGDGPRNCIGLRFGKMQAKIGLITLLKAFKFSRCEQTQVPLVLSKKNVLIESAHGIYVKIDKI